jgi:hypothetical protein
MDLETELTTDPEGRGYASMTPEAALLDLQELRYSGECRVTILNVASELGRAIAGRLAASMQTAAETDPLMAEMLAVVRTATGIDVGHDEARAAIDEMAANPNLELTADDTEAIKGLAAGRNSRLGVLGLGVPRLREIRAILEN